MTQPGWASSIGQKPAPGGTGGGNNLANGYDWSGFGGTQGGAAYDNSQGHGTGGSSIESNALQQVTNPEEQQAGYAQSQAAYYKGLQSGALGVNAPTIQNASQAELNQSRGQLNNLASSYMQVANGQGPMGQLAENQYQQAQDQSVAAQLAMAHSAPGGAIGAAGATRAAMENNAATTAGAAAQSGIIQAQQQQAGLAGAAGAYNQLGSMNLSQYQTQQQIDQEQALIKQQQTGQNEGFFTNLASNQSNQQQIANQATQSLGALGVQAGLGEAGTAVGAENATTNMIGAITDIGGATASAISGAAASDMNLKTGIQSEGESTQLASGPTTGQEAMSAGAGALSGASKGASAGSVVPGVGSTIGGAIGAVGGLFGSSAPKNMGAVSSPMPARAPDPAAQAQGGMMTSDERAKFAVERGRESMADAFLDHLHPYSYQYKNPGDEPRPATGGRYLGVMAQDLEQAPGIGRQLVMDTPGGKRVSIGAGLGAVMAGLGRVDERLKALESSHDEDEEGDDVDRFNESIAPSRRSAPVKGRSLADGIGRLAERVRELESRKS